MRNSALKQIIEKLNNHHYPLSEIQQGLLYHAFYGERPGCYVTHIQVQMNEPVNKKLFVKAWSNLIKRYDMLRASLHHHNTGEWFQQIHAPYPCDMTVYDLSKYTRKKQKKIIKETLLIDRKQGFTKEDFPLQRHLLFKKSTTSFLFVWSHSHILLSGPSAVMILKEVIELYDKLTAKDKVNIKFARSYQEYVDYMKRLDLGIAKKYWQKQLAGIEGECNLTNFSSQVNKDNKKKLQARHTVELGDLCGEYLTQVARNYQVTVNTIVLGAWGLILSQYCDSDDVTFGSVRALSEGFCQELAGVLINTLPIRVKINSDTTVQEYLVNIREQQKELREHIHTPLQKIQQWCDIESGGSLFNTFVDFKYQSLTEYYKSLGGNWDKRAVYFSNDTNYPLALEAYYEDHKWQFRLTYHCEYFTAFDIKNFGKQFIHVLQCIISNPEQYVSKVSTLSKAQEIQLLTQWHTTTTYYPRNKTVTELFSEQVTKTPTNIAVVHKNKKISYQQLENLSTRLSQQLTQLGCRVNTPVILCHDRDINAIVSMLAINKAGGAYVPVDPSHPTTYITSIINDTGATIILTQSKHYAKMSKTKPLKSCIITTVEHEINKKGNHCKSVSAQRLTWDCLIYIMYTSGSTGKPKGVKICHRGVVRLVKNSNYLEFDGSERIAQTSNIAFDTSIFEIWGALLNGGCLDIIDSTVILNPDAFFKTLRKNGITTMWLTSALFNQLVIARPDIFNTLSDLLVGGEALNTQIVNRLILNGRYRPRRIINGYGPTECTTFATFYDIPYDKKILGSVPIGKAIANTEVYILDRWCKPVPPGVIGTLYLGGDGIALGYLNNQESSNKAFIRSPFSKNASIYLYNTGDKVKWLKNGLIAYVGRSDEQIKIRGFRIELAAIEEEIYKFNFVKQCAVIVKNKGLNKTIYAYIVAEKNYIINNNYIKTKMQKILPTYMIPSKFISLSRLPLTKNGKLDQKALPDPDVECKDNNQIEKLTEIEQILANTWKDALGLKKINSSDNFFELGGDSIVSIQMITRLNNCNIAVTSEDIFNNPSIKDLAECILTKVKQAPVELRDSKDCAEIILSPIQQWFFYLDLQNVNYFNQEIEICYQQALSIESFKKALKTTINNFDGFEIRFKYDKTGKKWNSYYIDNDNRHTYQLYIYDIPLEYSNDEKSWIDDHQLLLHKKININSGPILIVSLYKNDNRKKTIIRMIAHHLIMDGVSWRILTDTLSNAYHDLVTKQYCKLHKPQSSYKKWCETLQVHAKLLENNSEQDYWNSQLKELIFEQQQRQLQFSHDYNTIVKLNKESTATTITQSLPRALTDQLLTSCNEIYRTTIEELLISALMLSTAQKDDEKRHTIYFDHEGHGRDTINRSINVSNTIGWFTCIKPIKLSVTSINDIGLVIKSVKEQFRTIPNAGIGYGLIQCFCKKKLHRHDRAQVVFNYLGQFNCAYKKDDHSQFTINQLVLKSSPKNRRGYVLEINALIIDHQLKISLTYSKAIHTDTVIKKLSQQLQKNLRKIIKHCSMQEKGQHTPSDFPLANLNQEALDKLANRYGNNLLEDIYPLSPIQDGILFHYLLKPYSEDYIVQAIMQFGRDFIPEMLQQAWVEICNHYAIFKSAFIFTHVQQPMQVVIKQIKLDYKSLNWTQLSANQSATKMRQLIKADRQKGFDLAKPPLLRITIIKQPNGAHTCVLCFHHILLGGWSLALVIKAALYTYRQLVNNSTPVLPEHTPYREFIRWVRSQNREDACIYWKKLLIDIEPRQLSIENYSATKPDYKEADHANESLIIDSKKMHVYKNFANKYHITMNTLVQGALGFVLCKYSMSNDIIIGATSSGRPTNIENTETMVGLIINTLPVFIQIGKDQTAIEYLKLLQLQGIKTRKYEYSSLTDIRHWCAVPSTQQLFDILFIYENYPFDYDELRKLGCKDIWINERTHYKLTFTVTQHATLALTADYDPYYYQSGEIRQLLQYVEVALDAILRAPTSPINRLQLHNQLTWQQIVHEYNNTSKKICAEQSLISQFINQKQLTPTSIAIRHQDETLSYHQLYQQSTQMAQVLLASGIGKQALVAICMHRSINNVIALLAIQLLSAIYLNLDANDPPNRLDSILSHSKTRYLITDQSTMNKIKTLPCAASLNIIEVDYKDTLPEDKMLALLPIAINHDDTAYVLYTSGTTGKPKGVMISHGALFNFLIAMKEQLDASNPENILAITPFTFDISGLELYLPLITGGTIVLADNSIVNNPQVLNATLKDNQVTIMQTTPALWQILQNNDWKNECKYLNKILCGGEALTPGLAQYLTDQCQLLWNVYGPTETTIWSTAYKITHLNTQCSYVSIGKPINNTQIFILDKNLNPLPHGITGELYIGGAGLAKAYIHQSQSTQVCFTDVEIQTLGTRRLYKTGDLARWNADGYLEYKGRIDHQIKLHGLRIELGEIEQQLCKAPGVSECAVIKSDDQTNPYLIGYIVLNKKNQTTKISSRKYREYLQNYLPKYMVPSQIFVIDKLPLNSNNKIDRNALPKPKSIKHFLEKRKIRPKTQTERTLVKIWADVLGLKASDISISNSFFDRGGDSFSAIQVIGKIQKILSSKVKISDLLQTENLHELAALIDRYKMSSKFNDVKASSDELTSCVIQLQGKGEKSPLFLIHPIGGTVFCYRPLAKYIGNEHPIYAIQDPGIDTNSLLFDTLDEMAATYLKMIKQQQPKGPYLLAGASFGANVAIEIARQLENNGDQVLFTGSIDGWALYPAKVNNDQTWFESHLSRQHKKFNRLATTVPHLPNTLIKLNWHRQQMLANYRIPDHHYHITLFKSSEVFPVFEPIECDLNHWDSINGATTKLIPVPGNHETMLEEPHVRVLGKAIASCLRSLFK